jgi:hypothetical protein
MVLIEQQQQKQTTEISDCHGNDPSNCSEIVYEQRRLASNDGNADGCFLAHDVRI